MKKRSNAAKIDKHGRITIPTEVRKLLGLRRGDSVIFVEEHGRVYLRVERNSDVFERFRGIGTPGIAPGRRGLLGWTREIRGR